MGAKPSPAAISDSQAGQHFHDLLRKLTAVAYSAMVASKSGTEEGPAAVAAVAE
jgi:hypothetical protein